MRRIVFVVEKMLGVCSRVVEGLRLIVEIRMQEAVEGMLAACCRW
jgi:hypothetical protein